MTTVFALCYLTLTVGSFYLFWKARGLPDSGKTTLVRIGLVLSVYFCLLKACLLSPILPWATHLIGTGAGFWYLIGPVVFVTVWVLIEPRARIRRVHSLHLFPLIWMMPGLLPFFALPAPDKMALFEASMVGPARVNPQSMLHMAIVMGYVGVSLKVAWHNLSRVPTKTLKTTVACLVLMVTVLAVEQALALFGPSRFLLTHVAAILVMALFLGAVSSALRFRMSVGWDAGISYLRTSADRTELENLGRTLIRLMDEDRLFLYGELQRHHVAERLGISDHRLSQVLSQVMETSFNTLVNEYRVREVQRILKDPESDNLTLLSIGHDAGFNSKSSFNRVFKEMVGQTPSEFREKVSKTRSQLMG